jgi:hypothetical protein
MSSNLMWPLAIGGVSKEIPSISLEEGSLCTPALKAVRTSASVLFLDMSSVMQRAELLHFFTHVLDRFVGGSRWACNVIIVITIVMPNQPVNHQALELSKQWEWRASPARPVSKRSFNCSQK